MGSILFAVILCLVFVPLWCLGLRMVSDFPDNDGAMYLTPAQVAKSSKILWRVRAYLLKKWPWAGKPVLTCVACMPSLHTPIVMLFVWWLLTLPLTFEFLVCIPFIAVCSSFTAGYYWSKYHGR